MNDLKKESLDDLITAINLVSYNDLIMCFKRQLGNFKYDVDRLNSRLDPELFYQAGQTMRDLMNNLELLLELSNFINYVECLQGILMETE